MCNEKVKLQVIQEFEHVVVAGEVTFSGKNFTMTCPSSGDWFRKTSTVESNGEKLEKAYDDTSKGQYHCEHGTAKEKYYFYVQARGE